MTETTTVRDAVATRKGDPKSVQIAKSYESQFADVLPEHIDVKEFVGSAVGALRKNPDLLAAAENSPTSFVVALMDCASLGHVPGSKSYYLTPRRNKASGKTEITGIEGYRGVIERMYRSGAVASVKVREVCKNDRFTYVEGEDEIPRHEVDWFGGDRGPMIGVYAYAKLTTGAYSRVVIMSAADVEAVRERSDAGSDRGRGASGPWVTDTRAMWWKTAAHRLEPWVPTSAEYRREQLRAAVQADNLRRRVNTETGEILDEPGDVVDAELVEG